MIGSQSKLTSSLEVVGRHLFSYLRWGDVDSRNLFENKTRPAKPEKGKIKMLCVLRRRVLEFVFGKRIDTHGRDEKRKWAATLMAM